MALTDNEIIKALECHAHRTERNLNCCDCDYIQHQDCSQRMSCDALDLINRQKAEIESLNKDLADTISLNYKERKELKAEIERLRENGNLLIVEAQKWLERFEEAKGRLANAICEKYPAIDDILADTNAEAIKEFAKKTNEMITQIYNKHIFGNNDLNDEEKDAIINFSDDVVSGFANLVKETVGDV